MPNDPTQLFDASGRLKAPAQENAAALPEARATFGRALASLPPSERLRALAAVMREASEGDWGPQINPQLLAELEKTRSALQSEVADVRFQLSEAIGRKEKAERQLETERLDNQRLGELLTEQKRQLHAAKGAIEERTGRLAEMQHQLSSMEASSAARGQAHQARDREMSELHERNALLQTRINETAEQLGLMERYYQQQCAEKDQMIQSIRAASRTAPRETAEPSAPSHAQNGSQVPEALWERLKSSNLKLGLAPEHADLQVALRVVEALELLTHSATTMNNHVAVVVSKHLPEMPAEMREDWRKYEERPLAAEVARAVVPSAGHPRVLRSKLRRLEDWHRALVIGHDAAFQPSAIAQELSRHMKAGDTKWNDRDTIREYLRAGGPQHFADALHVLCTQKIAAAYQNPAEGE